MVLEKKALAAKKQSYDLHVLLIMKQDNVTKAQALVNAYHEGEEFLPFRLSGKEPVREQPEIKKSPAQ